MGRWPRVTTSDEVGISPLASASRGSVAVATERPDAGEVLVDVLVRRRAPSRPCRGVGGFTTKEGRCGFCGEPFGRPRTPLPDHDAVYVPSDKRRAPPGSGER